MAATDLSDILFSSYLNELSKKEKLLLETILFSHLYQELTLYYRIESNHQMEGSMIDSPVIRGIVNDLLANNDYSLQGLANYTGYPEDVIYDLVVGMNVNPTLTLSAKIIELHAIARRDFYKELIKKVITKLTKESLTNG